LNNNVTSLQPSNILVATLSKVIAIQNSWGLQSQGLTPMTENKATIKLRLPSFLDLRATEFDIID